MLPWDVAWRGALFGDRGFFRRPEGPAGHFRTATHAGAPVLAQALVRLAAAAGCDTVLDVGAGRGELLAALAQAGAPGGAPALRLHGVDVVPRPPDLPAQVGWTAGLVEAGPDGVPGAVLDVVAASSGLLVVAWELLDTVPCRVVATGGDGVPRELLVDPRTGRTAPGGPPSARDLGWCRRWWPVEGEPDAVAEVGTGRDALWAALVGVALTAPSGGLLLAVDYAHRAGDRPPGGSLSAFRAGRAVPPVPDGSCDLTAHVAVDAVAQAGVDAGGSDPVLTTQRDALRTLGVTGHLRGSTVAQLRRASCEAELLDAGGLGGFTWLVQGAGRAVPALDVAP